MKKLLLPSQFIRFWVLFFSLLFSLDLFSQADLEAHAIQSPTSPQCFSSLQPIVVEIKNQGPDSLDFSLSSAMIKLQISGAQTHNYDTSLTAGILSPGEIRSIVLRNSADFTTSGAYELVLISTISGDTNPGNDTLNSTIISTPLVSTPAGESFDSFVSDGNFAGNGTGLANGFFNEPAGPTHAFNWSVGTGMTGSASTGPAGDRGAGNGSYMYVESSFGSGGDTALLISPCLDLTSTANPGLRFFFHMFGRGIGRLEVDVITKNSQTNIYAIDGQQQASSADPWLGETLDLAAFASDTIQVIFRAIRGNTSTGDIALDEVEIVDLPRIDLGLVSIHIPQSIPCVGAYEIEIELKNEGLDPLDFAISPVNVFGELRGMNPTAFSTQLNTGVLVPGISQTFRLTDSILFVNSGTDTLLMRVNVPGDGNSLNDSLEKEIITLPLLSAPFYEHFDDFTEEGSAVGSGTGIKEDWASLPNGPTNRFNWSVRNGPTGSSQTGPIADAGIGGMGNYLYTEASLGFSGDTAILISPCIDLSSLSFPQLSFAYHMFGSSTGRLEVFILYKGIRTSIFSRSGTQQNSSFDPFEVFRTDLYSFAGDTIQLLFKGIKGNGTAGDMAIDEIRIEERLDQDLAVYAVLSPDLRLCSDSSTSLQVQLENVGRSDLDFGINPANIQVELSGANTGMYAIPLLSDILPADSNMTVVVSPVANFAQIGSTYLTVTLSLMGQSSQPNDTLNYWVEVIPVYEAPFVETFASFIPDSNDLGAGTGLVNGWTQNQESSATTFNWSIKKGPTGSSLTGPDVDHTLGTADGIYLYTESSHPGEKAELLSPCIDISTFSHPALRFWYHMYGVEMGSLEVYVVAGENEWLLTSISGQQQSSGASPWLEGLFLLPSGIGDTVQIKFVGSQADISGSFSSDMALDDVELLEVPTTDLALVAISPRDTLCADAALPLSLNLKNLGINTIDFSQDSGTLDLSIRGADSLHLDTTIRIGSLAFQEEIDLAFLLDLSAVGTYQITGSIREFIGDANQENDTLRTSIHTFAPINTFPYAEDFEMGSGEWQAGGTNSSWELGQPVGPVIDTAASGQHAWVTNLVGFYASEENSWVESPCFDLRDQEGAWIFLDIWYESESGWDGAVLQSSLDLGASWQNVGIFGSLNNWFNDTSISAMPGGQRTGWSGSGPKGSGEWLQAAYALDTSITGRSGVQFRIAFASDRSVETEGFAFDNVRIEVPEFSVDLGENDTLCVGAVLDAGPGQSYLWSTGDTTRTLSFDSLDTSIVDSLVSVQVRDELGIFGSDSVRISVANGAPVADFEFEIQGGDVEFQNTSRGDFLSYRWDFGDGTHSQAPDTSHFYGVNGDYVVTLLVQNVCGEDSRQDTVRMTTTDISEQIASTSKLYPNPTTGNLVFQWRGTEVSEARLRVFSLYGAEIWQEETDRLRKGYKKIIDLPEQIAPGIYFLKIETERGIAFLKFERK